MGEKRSAKDWFKAGLIAVGAIGGGLWIALAPPAELVEEVPWHAAIGFGLAAFGTLFAFALFVTRAKSLLLFLAVGAFAAMGMWVAVIAGDMELWQRALIGAASFFAAIYAMICLVSVFTGGDPVDEPGERGK